MDDDPPKIPPVTEQEVGAVLCEAKGDAREAIRMLLYDIAVLAFDADRMVSYGFVRGRALCVRVG